MDASSDVRRLSAVDRFSSIPVAVRENVAEHSFWVVLYAMMIHAELGGPDSASLGVVSYAAVHDLPECLTGDVVRTFKYSSTEMREAVDAAEGVLVQRLPAALLAVYDLASEFALDGPHAWYVKAVVKAADFLSLYQYMWREKLRGNREVDQFFSRMQNDMAAMSSHMSEQALTSDDTERRRIMSELAVLYGAMREDRFSQEFTTT